MVDKLTSYETKILNRIILKTTEGSSFSVYDILNSSNNGLSGFDKGYVPSVDQIALTLSNFLIDKGLAKKAHPDKPAFERILIWTDKGVKLKKYRRYQLFRFMSDTLPELAKITGLIVLIAGLIWTTIQIYNSCNKPTTQVKAK